MGNSFTAKAITVTVQLAQGSQTSQPSTFAESGTDTVTISGLRTEVRAENVGSPVNARARVKVWGLTPSLMNQLSTLGLVFNLVPKNVLTIAAGDLGGQMSTIFTGTVWSAYGDYESQPMVPFVFDCLSGGADQVVSTPPTSFSGKADVATIMSGFARQMNLGFENNGVNLQLSNPSFRGSVKLQAQTCAEHAGISWAIANSTLAIWPKGGNRNTPTVPKISRPPGSMIGYPAFTQQGIIVKTLFDPTIAFGSLVEVDSSVLAGIAQAQPQQQTVLSTKPSTFPTQWAVNKLDLALDALLPKGQWMSTVYAYNPGYAKTILPPT